MRFSETLADEVKLVPVSPGVYDTELTKRLRPGLIVVHEMVKDLPAEALLKGVPLEKRVEGFSADDLFNALSPQALEAVKQRLADEGSTSGKP